MPRQLPSHQSQLVKKKLYIRLSSLGDVVLATSALEIPENRDGQIDWLTSKEFADLVEGHPRVTKVWSFDRKSGFAGWKALCRKLWDANYDEIVDLHGTIRTRVMRILFFYWMLTESRASRELRVNSGTSFPRPAWKRSSKQRFRLYGYFIFKSLWPKAFRPDHVSERAAKLVGGTGQERAKLDHLVLALTEKPISPAIQAVLEKLSSRSYVCVMPGSKWAAKKWPVQHYAELLARAKYLPVVMGTSRDRESAELVQALRRREIEVVSAIGDWSLRDVARILKGAWRYLGNDTGLGHLAEALGVPSFVIFGPTRGDMGFGPSRAESRAIGKAMLCRPCGKDGRYCFRLDQRFACMTALTANEVASRIPEMMKSPERVRTAPRRTFRALAYVLFMQMVFQRVVLPLFASKHRLREGRKQWDQLLASPGLLKLQAESIKTPRIWWHAASVGELEILWPVILSMAERDRSRELILTVLSESAEERLSKLSALLKEKGITIVFSGYSPWEGSWRKALEALRPDLFVTSKYEAWPELWSELSRLGVPLSIVSAKGRRSISICKRVCANLGMALPNLNFLTAQPSDAEELQRDFPDQAIEVVGEPRWDQVWKRAQTEHLRVKEISSAMVDLRRPWGVLGSVWPEDVELWEKILRAGAASFLIVPHRVDREHVAIMEKKLLDAHIGFIRSSSHANQESMRRAIENAPNVCCILVDEMGFLSELYQWSDWAYVGGGVGRRGVHSTIEPAMHGIPVSCGTYRAQQFTEIEELSKSEQLTLIRTVADLEAWFAKVSKTSAERVRWKAEAQARLGATERIVAALSPLLD